MAVVGAGVRVLACALLFVALTSAVRITHRKAGGIPLAPPGFVPAQGALQPASSASHAEDEDATSYHTTDTQKLMSTLASENGAPEMNGDSDAQADAARALADRYLAGRVGKVHIINNVNQLKHSDKTNKAAHPDLAEFDYERSQAQREAAISHRILEREEDTKRDQRLIDELKRRDSDEAAQKDAIFQKRVSAAGLFNCVPYDRSVKSLMARWNFEKDFKDQIGALHLSIDGDVQVNGGAAIFQGNGTMQSPPLPLTLAEKTLEVWVKLLDSKQRNVGVISLQKSDGTKYDGIAYGDQSPGFWTASSEGSLRSELSPRDKVGSEPESGFNEYIQVAIVYGKDNSITIYRNGELYHPSYTPKDSNIVEFGKDSFVLLGAKNSQLGRLKGSIAEARLYSKALTEAQVIASHKTYSSCGNKQS